MKSAKIISIASLLMLIILSNNSYANFGPAKVSPITRTGNIELVEKENIHIDEELLYIEVDGDFLNVRVEYKFVNRGVADNVKLAFPADHLHNSTTDVFHFEEITFPNFTVYDGEKELETIEKKAEEKDINIDEEFKRFKDIHDPHEIISLHRKWYLSELFFNENEEKLITVKYRVSAGFVDWEQPGLYYSSFDKRYFVYDFLPAKNWGDGIINDFKIIIDCNKLYEVNGELEKINIDGFKEKDNLFTYEKKDFDISQNSFLSMSYDISIHHQSRYIDTFALDNKYIDNIKTSSCLGEGYTADLLFDKNINTAWVEGKEGNGINEWIEIEFKTAIGMRNFFIVNGYYKNRNVYEANSKVKTLKLEFLDEKNNVLYEKKCELENKKYEYLDKNNFIKGTDLLFCEYEGTKYYPKKVRATILDVYPGNKYQDTCIGEIIIFEDSNTKELSEEELERPMKIINRYSDDLNKTENNDVNIVNTEEEKNSEPEESNKKIEDNTLTEEEKSIELEEDNENIEDNELIKKEEENDFVQDNTNSINNNKDNKTPVIIGAILASIIAFISLAFWIKRKNVIGGKNES